MIEEEKHKLVTNNSKEDLIHKDEANLPTI